MSHDLVLSPSILSADFARLADEIDVVADHVGWLHVDVMDAHYVPNLTIGPPVIKALRGATDLPFDTHLMISEPRRWAEDFVAAGSTSLTFHPSTDDEPLGLIRHIRSLGVDVGIAIRPSEDLDDFLGLLPHVDLVLAMTVEPGFGGQAFMSSVLPKIAELDRLRRTNGWTWRLEVDGGVAPDTVAACAEAGADTFVAGSAVFGKEDRIAAITTIMDRAAEGRSRQVLSIEESERHEAGRQTT